MALPKTHKQEILSLAYIRAIVASAGAHFTQEESPEYGIDCTIKQVRTIPEGKYTFSGYPLLCQVKSTTNWIEYDDRIAYDFDSEAYNKLVSVESNTAILIVFRQPKTELEWLNCTADCLEIRNCCYWVFLTGPVISNTSKKRIFLPRSQIFDPQAVNYLLECLQRNKGSLDCLI